MALNEQIRTPVRMLAIGEEITFTIVKSDARVFGQWDWYSSDVQVPVIRNENLLPFRVTAKTGFKIPEYINIVIAKKRNEPIITMALSNFGSLPDLFSHGVLNVMAIGKFSSFTFSHRNTPIAVNPGGRIADRDIEVFVSDKCLVNFESKVGPGWHKGYFDIQMFWAFNFLQEKIDYFHDIHVAIQTEHVDGYLELQAHTGKAKHIPKCLLAASSPKFKAQFEQEDSIRKLAFTIDGDVIITEESLEALQKFISLFSLQVPMEKCWVAADLLMAGHYHIFSKMESVMQSIILAQPREWFDLNTSARLFTLAAVVAETKNDPGEKQAWENLKWKTLRNMNSASLEDLNNCTAIADVDFNTMKAEMIKMVASLA